MDKNLEYLAMRQFLKLLDDPGKSLNRVFNTAREELTQRQDEMIHMYYIDQLPMREISEILGVNVSTVSRTIARGKTRLHKALRYGRRSLLDTLCGEFDDDG